MAVEIHVGTADDVEDALAVHLWTHEDNNERARRLYRTCGFRQTGTTAYDADGLAVAEWLRER